MVLEQTLEPIGQWLPWALIVWAGVLVILFAIGSLVAWGSLAIAHGPKQAVRGVLRGIHVAATDWFAIAPRRVGALAGLAVREAIRSRILIVLVLFGVVLAMAGWFIAGGDRPARIFLGTVFFWITFLLVIVSLLVSALSLPADITRRTLFTVLTKPVRASEIVLGRVLGFSIVGTALLALMGAVGYVFVVRMVDHTHSVSPDDVVELELPPPGGEFSADTPVEEGRLTDAAGHHHTFRITAAGEGWADSAAGHVHRVTKDVTPRVRYAKIEQGDSARVAIVFSEPMDPVAATRTDNYQASGGLTVGAATVSDTNRRVTLTLSGRAEVGRTTITVSEGLASRVGHSLAEGATVAVGDRDLPPETILYAVGSPENMFRARVPLYGELHFTDDAGQPKPVGISVGSEWAYRSYINGATQSSAVWTFDGVSEERFGDVLPLEITIRVYRTHKGRVDMPVRGTLVLRNPDHPDVATKPQVFYAADQRLDQQYCPRTLRGTDAQGRSADLDLYRDLVSDGKLQVVLQCIESGQLYGVARADAFLLVREGSFALNYVKCCLTVWLQMLLVIAMAVMFSTLLSGPVALFATMTTLVMGFFSGFMGRIIGDQMWGGGPLEAAYRLQNRMNLVTKLEPGFFTDLIQWGDWVIRFFLACLVTLFPDYSRYSHIDYLAEGFAIPWQNIALLAISTLGYVVPMLVIGHVLLRSREIAA
ncbi:MAG: hypothetical protein WD176_04785 [Pirellulales bacterium]